MQSAIRRRAFRSGHTITGGTFGNNIPGTGTQNGDTEGPLGFPMSDALAKALDLAFQQHQSPVVEKGDDRAALG